MLRLQDIVCRRRGRLVLDQVTLSLRAREGVVVDGARGTGKSVLLAVAAAVLRPHGGSVWVAGRNLLDLQAASLPFVRRNIGYLPPDPVFVEDETVLENVILPLAIRGLPVAEAEARAAEELERLGLASLQHETVARLSQSERRLVALARALVGRPVAIVLDEPGSGLDAEDRERVAQAIAVARATGAAVLCASADPGFVALLQAHGLARVTLQDGRLVGATPRMVVVGGDPRPPSQPSSDEGEELNEQDLEALGP